MRKLTSKQMSIIYWKKRNRGYSHHSAFISTGLAQMISKKYGFGKGTNWKFGKYAYYDFDGDGKVNRFDCNPLNPWKQDQESLDNYKRQLRKYAKEENILNFQIPIRNQITEGTRMPYTAKALYNYAKQQKRPGYNIYHQPKQSIADYNNKLLRRNIQKYGKASITGDWQDQDEYQSKGGNYNRLLQEEQGRQFFEN